MSHAATNWAIKQRGLKPAAKVVLWHLCDRYHPDHGCFPSLDTLAADCEMSRRSVQDQLATLEAAGLVTVEKMPREHGQLPRNRYRFAFEQDGNSLGQNLPQAEFALGKNTSPPLANSRNHLGQNLPTKPVRVTSKGTGNLQGPLKEPLPADWALDDDGWAYARSLQLTDTETQELADDFREYWRERRDADSRKTERGWRQAWRNRCLDMAPRLKRNRSRYPADDPALRAIAAAARAF
jgi:hypothetical protein